MSFLSGGETNCVVQIRAQKGLRVVEDLGGGRRRDGKAFERGGEGDDSNRSERSKREADCGEGPLPNGLLRIDEAAMVPQV